MGFQLCGYALDSVSYHNWGMNSALYASLDLANSLPSLSLQHYGPVFLTVDCSSYVSAVLYYWSLFSRFFA